MVSGALPNADGAGEDRDELERLESDCSDIGNNGKTQGFFVGCGA
jgi:hypothetical protein